VKRKLGRRGKRSSIPTPANSTDRNTSREVREVLAVSVSKTT
jgi:hypothetical protein